MKYLIYTAFFLSSINVILGGDLNHGDTLRYKSCDHVKVSGYKESGNYKIWFNNTFSHTVFCNHTEDNAYIIVLRRMYGNVAFQGKPWASYLYPFGYTYGDYWAGLNNMYYWSRNEGYNVLTMTMQDWSGTSQSVRYSHFEILDNVHFKLSITGFTGNVPDDMKYTDLRPFATPDKPDPNNCARNQNTGWWFNYCAHTLPTGHYYPGGAYTPRGGWYDGIYWADWRGYGYSLKYIDMILSKA